MSKRSINTNCCFLLIAGIDYAHIKQMLQSRNVVTIWLHLSTYYSIIIAILTFIILHIYIF